MQVCWFRLQSLNSQGGGQDLVWFWWWGCRCQQISLGREKEPRWEKKGLWIFVLHDMELDVVVIHPFVVEQDMLASRPGERTGCSFLFIITFLLFFSILALSFFLINIQDFFISLQSFPNFFQTFTHIFIFLFQNVFLLYRALSWVPPKA